MGSLVCALAGSLEWLIAGRVVQGTGAALGPLAIGLARDHAPRERAPVWIGLLVAAAGAGAALGLVLGGVLVPAWSANLVAFAMGFSLFIAGVIVPQLSTLPDASGYGFGLTFTQTGLVLLPGALAIVVGGWASGALVRRTGVRALVGCGAVFAAAAYAGLALDHGGVIRVHLGESSAWHLDPAVRRDSVEVWLTREYGNSGPSRPATEKDD